MDENFPVPPPPYQSFREDYPEVYAAYDKLGAAVHAAGKLDARTRELIKLGMAIGARYEGAVNAHVRKALAVGATPDEIRQVVILAIPTMGFPTMMAALTWVEDEMREQATGEDDANLR
jgi:4-carboxymuconolactone decarboxylase